MRKNALAALILVLFFAGANAQEQNITWNRASALAQARYSELKTMPQSVPAYPVEVASGKYWVVEFDNVWVPVAYSDGKILTAEAATIKEVYRIHWSIQQVSSQRSSDKYPTKQKLALTGFFGDVKNHEKFIETNKGKLPAELQSGAANLLDKTTSLRVSVEDTIANMGTVEAAEADLLSSSSGQADLQSWEREFSSLLDNMLQISSLGDRYEESDVAFEKAADSFIKGSNDTQAKSTVQDFVNGLGMFNTISLVGLGTSSNEWRTTFIGVQLSNDTLSEKVEELYSSYSEAQSEISVVDLQNEAFEKLDALKDAPALIARLSKCPDELDTTQQKQLKSLNDSYSKAVQHYEDGNSDYNDLQYAQAKEHYLNVDAYANEASEKLASLKSIECSGQPGPETPTVMEIISNFLGSTMGLLTIGLVLVLVIIVWWNRRKGEEDYEDKLPSMPRF